MKVIGDTYQVAWVFNPMGLYPARVYPVYRLHKDRKGNGNIYRQICDSQGVISDFLEVKRSNSDRLTSFFARKSINAVGQPAIYGYALSESEIIIVRGESEYKSALEELLGPKRRRLLFRNPFGALELARYLKKKNLEAVFAGTIVRTLAARSPKAADGWIRHAPLSELARVRGQKMLTRALQKNDTKSPDDEIVTILMSASTLVQGSFYGILPDGKTLVRVGNTLYPGYRISKQQA